MLTHGATVRAYDAWSTVVGLREGDRYLVVNPFFHSFGLNAGIVASLVKGATIIPHAVFDVDAVMKRAAEEQVSMLPGPPTVYQSILDHPRLAEFDMSSLRLAVTGAARFPSRWSGACAPSSASRRSSPATASPRRPASRRCAATTTTPRRSATTSGRAIPDVEVLVVDDEGREVPRGEPGEVVIRGYNVMQGFIHDPEATAEAIDADGWLHTGDVAVMNDRGYIRITDRTKDMFIVGGFNAYPAEIENMINEHPAVGQVAVVGVPDDRMGEVGYAFVIPRLNASITPDELTRVVPREDGELQGAALLRDRRRVPAERERQGAEVRAARTGAQRVELTPFARCVLTANRADGDPRPGAGGRYATGQRGVDHQRASHVGVQRGEPRPPRREL